MPPVLDMSRVGVIEPKLIHGVLRRTNLTKILRASDVIVPIQHPLAVHPGLDEEGLERLQVGALHNLLLLDLVRYLEALVGAIVAGPHDDVLSINISAGGDVHAESSVAEGAPVVVAFGVVPPLLG